MDKMQNEQMLKRLHREELLIMDEFDRICRENGLSYFLDSGSALGAVRHGGFIPWDDDVDVGMLRKDYDRFVEIARKSLRPGFTLQSHETDGRYYKFNCKLRKDNTVFPEKGSEGYRHRGIFIDVFPFDYLSDDDAEAKREIARSRIFYSLAVLRQRRIAEIRNPFKLICRVLLSVLSEDWYRNRFSRICLAHTETSQITCFSYKMLKDKDLVFKTTEMVPVKPIRFEDRTYSIMNNTDSYLKQMYGDYMKLPPEDQRVCHVNARIVFDTNAEKA